MLRLQHFDHACNDSEFQRWQEIARINPAM